MDEPARTPTRHGRRPAARGAEAARRAARREQLLDAAIAAIKRHGADDSMTEIASEAGVTKPILYRHFGHRHGLYQAIAERYVRSLSGEIERAFSSSLDHRDLLAATLDAYLSFLDRETSVYRFLSHRALEERPEMQATLTGFRTQVALELSGLLADRLGPRGLNEATTEPWAFALVGMATAVGEWWMEKRSMSREQLVTELTAALWGGFRAVIEQTEPPVGHTPAAATRIAEPEGARG